MPGRQLRFVAFGAVLLLLFSGPLRAAPDAPRAAGAIPVYVFAGQSNMVGASASAAALPTVAPALARHQQRVLFFGPDDGSALRWTTLGPRTEHSQTSYGPGFGPELAAAAELTKHRSLIAVVKYARNGTNLYHDWNPDRRDGFYANLVNRARRAIDTLELQTRRRARVAGFFWMQGEGDSYRYAHASRYAEHLRRLIARVRSDLAAPDLPVVIGRIAWISGPYSPTVRTAQDQVARSDPLARVVETDDLTHDPNSLVHLDTLGEVDLGSRFAGALAR